MSDTSPAIPESIDPANQHKALTAGQQAVIKKLFRRLTSFCSCCLSSRSLIASTSALPDSRWDATSV